jgi:endonuclease-3
VRRADKAVRIRRILDRYYPSPAVPLRHGSPFQLLCAVVLSAQTTDEQVNRVTPELFRKAPTARSMAALRSEQVLAIIRPCGLAPTKAANLVRLSKLIEERHGGAVPRTLGELEALPGVGHKTASVVVTQAFGEPAFPVDTHVHRLAGRWGLSRARDVAETEGDLKKLFPKDSWGTVHLQIILFGRQQCPARGHDLAACPICSWAASKRRIVAESRPGPARKPAVRRR